MRAISFATRREARLAGDVVFYGNMEGWFKALDARTGQVLWQFKTGSGIIGQPITYRGPDGKQYIAVLSGIGGWPGAVVVNDLDTRDRTAANGWGETMRDSGDFAAALSWHSQALTLARQVGDRLQQARALEGLGDGYQGKGEHSAALDHWRQAHQGYTELGHPAADRTRAKIDNTALPHQ